MKRLILISCCLVSFSFCVQARRTPFDPNSPINLLSRLLVSTATFSGSSNSTSSLFYSAQTFNFYAGETVSISATTSNVTSCSTSSTLPTGLTLNTGQTH